jgi:hypothetical protein
MGSEVGVLLAGLTRAAAELQMAFGIWLVVSDAEAAVPRAAIAVAIDVRRDWILRSQIVSLSVLCLDFGPVPRTICLAHCSHSLRRARDRTC